MPVSVTEFLADFGPVTRCSLAVDPDGVTFINGSSGRAGHAQVARPIRG